jgi:sugar O-acyltransferase (sialic acid O-acetyltransferase NeuD family)
MINPVIIFGAKATGFMALDALLSNDIVIYGFLDDDYKVLPTELGEFTLFGAYENEGYTKLIGPKCDAIVAVDDLRVRKYLVEYLQDKRKVAPVNALHNLAHLGTDIQLGHGNIVGARVYLAPFVQVGSYNVIGTNTIIESNSIIGDYCTILSSVTIASNVTIGNDVFIGTGAVIVSGVNIGKKARIGAGSVVVESIPDGATVFGNPATKVKA